jgi:probable HAF family extracellular repeat protein
MGLNDFGQAVGSSGTCATQGLPPGHVNGLHAVLWEADGTPKDLGRFGDKDHAMSNNASSINDLGDVVGTSEANDGTVHSFLWTKAKGRQDLGTLTPAAFLTVAGCCRTVNNLDEVVGFSIDPNGSTAFLWRDGKIKDLNTLIPANSPLHLLGAYSINDEGEIAGQACVLPACTEMHAYRLTPKW